MLELGLLTKPLISGIFMLDSTPQGASVKASEILQWRD